MACGGAARVRAHLAAGARAIPFAVELFLDPAPDDAVQAIWRALADAGLSRSMLNGGSHPHVSLAVCADLDAQLFRRALEEFARVTPPLEFVLASVGAFPTDEGVVFLAPVVTGELLDLYRDLHAYFKGFGVEYSPYYRPGNWVPHCALAMGVARGRIADAVRVCLKSTLPIHGRFERIALVEFRPVKVIYAFDLVRR